MAALTTGGGCVAASDLGGKTEVEATGTCATGSGAGTAGTRAGWRVWTVRLAGTGVAREASGEADCGAVAAGVAGGWSPGRVAVPGKRKFCSSLGPTVLGAGVLVAGGSAVFWAAAATDKNHSPPATNIVLKRKFALIAPALSRDSPLALWRRKRAMPATPTGFKHAPDERWRNPA